MIFILALFSGLMGAQTADLAVTGAQIYTGNSQNSIVSAIAVKDGKVLAVGENIDRYLGPSTRRIDAKGATIVPGFIDSHVHMRSLGDALEILDLRATRSAEQIAEIVRRAALGRKRGEWIRGRAWDQTAWASTEFPTAGLLSAAAPDNPVYLTRVDGHAAWVNQKALETAGVNAATPDPAGGRILRTPSGAPSGVLIDRAQELVARHIPADTPEQARRHMARAAQECARLGLTSVHDAGVTALELDAYRRLVAEHQLPVRVYAMIRGEGPLWNASLRRGPEIGDWLTVRSIKLVADGALGSRGAALLAPYADDPGNIGLLILQKSDIERVARQAVAGGFQVNTHAIGDRANRIALEAYAAALQGRNDRRFRIEHAQVIALDDIPLFAKYSVLASMQSTHATRDMRWAEARLGPERIRGAYAWRRFLALGVPVANGSDFPVEEPNPLWGFYSAVTRQDPAGSPAGGWFPDQRMTREEALRSWTFNGAYAAFEEKTKGSLEPGKLADFVMLSRDIMTIPAREILSTRVKMTVVGGEIVYSDGAIFEGVIEVPRAEWNYVDIGAPEPMTVVNCEYQVLSKNSPVRAVWIARRDLVGFRAGRRDSILAATPFGADGRLRHVASEPGDYAMILENQSASRARAEVKVRVWMESAVSPGVLSPQRRFAVILISVLVFGGIVWFAAFKLRAVLGSMKERITN